MIEKSLIFRILHVLVLPVRRPHRNKHENGLAKVQAVLYLSISKTTHGTVRLLITFDLLFPSISSIFPF
jgi:hypothetical protein